MMASLVVFECNANSGSRAQEATKLAESRSHVGSILCAAAGAEQQEKHQLQCVCRGVCG